MEVRERRFGGAFRAADQHSKHELHRIKPTYEITKQWLGAADMPSPQTSVRTKPRPILATAGYQLK